MNLGKKNQEDFEWEEGGEKSKNPKELTHFYIKRIELIRSGKKSYEDKDYLKALTLYNQYIELISEIKEVEEDKLHPHLFDREEENVEIMILSYAYWNLSKMYDRAPYFKENLLQSLEQFRIFSMNYPWQDINIQTIRKFILTENPTNKEDFQKTYKMMYTSSKKCYIASHALGPDHPVTDTLRDLKKAILTYPFGHLLIDRYYHNSPKIIAFFSRYPRINFLITVALVKPALRFIASLWRRKDKPGEF
ncbi:MAG: hypothetical protein OXB88_08270 [Bacteriovoracales bacterium]|nr:hypothetical protein [Bacteriovoracales bacterium]